MHEVLGIGWGEFDAGGSLEPNQRECGRSFPGFLKMALALALRIQ